VDNAFKAAFELDFFRARPGKSQTTLKELEEPMIAQPLWQTL
jgi:hypothetical protein